MPISPIGPQGSYQPPVPEEPSLKMPTPHNQFEASNLIDQYQAMYNSMMMIANTFEQKQKIADILGALSRIQMDMVAGKVKPEDVPAKISEITGSGSTAGAAAPVQTPLVPQNIGDAQNFIDQYLNMYQTMINIVPDRQGEISDKMSALNSLRDDVTTGKVKLEDVLVRIREITGGGEGGEITPITL